MLQRFLFYLKTKSFTMGKIISVVNNKGGVGKTTITVNLAHALAMQGKKVLIVDVDSQCNSTSFFNLAPGCASLYELLASVYDEEAPEIKPESCIYPTEIGCSILPNVEEMAFIEAEFYKNESYIVALRERLREYATKEFDITLIDCPPSMGAFVYMAMIASDFIIVPIRAGSRFSLDGITKTINAINQIRRTKLNEGLVLLKFLYNMADLRRLADKHSLTILNNRYPGQVLTEYISEATMLRSSEMLSETVFQSSPRSKVAAKFRSVAREILAALGM